MIVMNHDGDLFEERRKKDRRTQKVKVNNERRVDTRRKDDINKTKKKKW